MSSLAVNTRWDLGRLIRVPVKAREKAGKVPQASLRGIDPLERRKAARASVGGRSGKSTTFKEAASG